MIIRNCRRRRLTQFRGLNRAWVAADVGQSLVELALAMPLLILMLVGAAEFARVSFAAIEVENAAKAGVQYAAYSRANAVNLSAIQAAATNEAPNITLGTTTVASACICSGGAASTCASTDCPTSNIEQIVTVTTQGTFDPLVHLPGLPTTFALHGVASQKVINQ
jgi:Flp pilus assembly protein TadG